MFYTGVGWNHSPPYESFVLRYLCSDINIIECNDQKINSEKTPICIINSTQSDNGAASCRKGAENKADTSDKNQNYPNRSDLQIKVKITFFSTDNEKRSREDDVPFQRSAQHCQTNVAGKIKVIVLHCLKTSAPPKDIPSHGNTPIVMTCTSTAHTHPTHTKRRRHGRRARRELIPQIKITWLNMEREQRSEELLRDFIRANCQRMKHELANRDCRQGRYRRDPWAAAAVTPQQTCETDTRYHATDTRGVNADWPDLELVLPEERGSALRTPHPEPQIQTAKCLKICVCPYVSLPACF